MLSLRHRNGEVRFIAWRNRLLELPETPPFVLGHGIDVTEKTDAENKLHSVMRQRESILESVGDGIYGVDMEGKIIFVNDVGARMMGYTQEEMEGKELLEMLGHARADGSVFRIEESPIYAASRSSAPIRARDEVFRHKDGHPVPVEYVACPMFEREGDGRGGGVPGRDGAAATGPDEGRVYFDGEPRAAHAADGAPCCPGTDRGRGAGEAAGEASADDGRGDRQLRPAGTAGERHSGLRADGGGTAADAIPGGRGQGSAAAATDLQHPNAQKAGIGFLIDAGPLTLWVDEDRILQTLGNLISNAIKFSPGGSEITLRARTQSATEAIISVSDRGRGVPKEKLEIIFERFQQVDASDSRDMGGTGLGLAICRNIVRQHGGRIWAESIVGRGSTFYFTVPLTAARQEQGEAPAQASSQSPVGTGCCRGAGACKLQPVAGSRERAGRAKSTVRIPPPPSPPVQGVMRRMY